jgi:hypothetical protein
MAVHPVPPEPLPRTPNSFEAPLSFIPPSLLQHENRERKKRNHSFKFLNYSNPFPEIIKRNINS